MRSVRLALPFALCMLMSDDALAQAESRAEVIADLSALQQKIVEHCTQAERRRQQICIYEIRNTLDAALSEVAIFLDENFPGSLEFKSAELTLSNLESESIGFGINIFFLKFGRKREVKQAQSVTLALSPIPAEPGIERRFDLDEELLASVRGLADTIRSTAVQAYMIDPAETIMRPDSITVSAGFTLVRSSSGGVTLSPITGVEAGVDGNDNSTSGQLIKVVFGRPPPPTQN